MFTQIKFFNALSSSATDSREKRTETNSPESIVALGLSTETDLGDAEIFAELEKTLDTLVSDEEYNKLKYAEDIKVEEKTSSPIKTGFFHDLAEVAHDLAEVAKVEKPFLNYTRKY